MLSGSSRRTVFSEHERRAEALEFGAAVMRANKFGESGIVTATGMDRGERPAKLKRLGRHRSFDVLGEFLEFGDLFEGYPLIGVL